MKQFTGTVVSTKMNKTVVVEVVSRFIHPLYKKTLFRTKKYLVHDEKDSAKVGQKIMFSETKPISKKKRFIVLPSKKQSK